MTNKYLFDNRIESLTVLLDEIIHSVRNHYYPYIQEDIISCCKHALIELLTNGVKHSACETSTIEIILGLADIVIRKSDSGAPFLPGEIESWPLAPEWTGNRILICQDDFNSVYAIVKSPVSLFFEVEERPIDIIGLSSAMLDHYGFLILSKVSATFTFDYNPESKLNIFTAQIELKN